ncbi:MAG: tetratricopeptide repeat protein [Acidobacteria bacterium]|nr:tetratricopeptide repeat protein [Acidobacteriota bacterium]
MAVPAGSTPLGNDSAKQVQRQLDRILGSRTFREAGRLKRFIGFVIGEALAGRADQLKEYVVGVAVFDKKESFDPRTDPIVRVQARRLRSMLDRYYREEGFEDEVVIQLPKGGYGPAFKNRRLRVTKPLLSISSLGPNTVAVLTFSDHSPAGDLGYFCEGVRQEIICGISKLPQIRILACHPGELSSEGSPVRETNFPNAATIVSGSIRRSGNELRIAVHLVDGASGCYVCSETVDGDLQDTFIIQKEIAHLVVQTLQNLAAGQLRASRQQAVNSAHNLCIQARYHLNQRTEEALRKAVEFFEKAIAEDAQYALAHSGLADAYGLLAHYGVLAPSDVWAKAASSAATAVMLDEGSAEATTSLAHVKATQDWDWAGAEVQFQKAIALNAGYPTAHHWYAMSCLVPLGRLDEALDQALTAEFLDPVSSIIARDIAVIYYYKREFDLALEHCDHTIELNPHFSPAFLTLGLIQAQRHDFEEAEAAFQRAIHLSPNTPRVHAALGRLYAGSGKRKAALEFINRLKEMAKSRYVSPFEFATFYFALQQADVAFDWLAKAFEDRCFELLSVNVDPGLDLLRAHPQFASIAEQFARCSIGTEPVPPDARSNRFTTVKRGNSYPVQ